MMAKRELPENVHRMRRLAAQMRACASETSLNLYRRQFEQLASELEEAAVDQESRGPKPH